MLTVTTECFSRHLYNLGLLAEEKKGVPDIEAIKKDLVAGGFLTDPMGQLVVEIDPRDVMPKGTYAKHVKDWCWQLTRIQVQFQVKDWNGYGTALAFQSLFIGLIEPFEIGKEENGKIYLSLSNWAIPYFLFFGASEVFYGKVEKKVALSLPGVRTKRIYKMTCSMHGKKGNVYELPLAEFRRILNMEQEERHRNGPNKNGSMLYQTKGTTYMRADTVRPVLETARKEIIASGADIWFDYELVTRNGTGRRGRQAKDTVVFFLHSRGKYKFKSPADDEERGKLVALFTRYANYSFINYMCVQESVERILEAGAGRTVLKKHDYYWNRLVEVYPDRKEDREFVREQFKHEFNIIVKLLRMDYDIILNTYQNYKPL